MEYEKYAEVTPQLLKILDWYQLPKDGWKQSIVGFSNCVWMHDKYVIKIYDGNIREKTAEQWFYREISSPFAPECLGMGEDHLILERIQGKGLFHYWPKWSEERRQQAFREGCRMIKRIHDVDTKKFPLEPEADEAGWKDWILNRICSKLDVLKSVDPEQMDLYDRVRSAAVMHADALEGNTFCLTYPDFHLDNLIWNEEMGKLYLIDYEDLCIAPADYFLDTTLRMIAYPFLYANEIDDPLQRKEHYEGLMTILQEELPECFAHPRWRERVLLYALAYDLRQLANIPRHELLQKRVTDSVKELEL